MNRFYLSLLFACLLTSCFAQDYFEGEVHFKTTYQSLHPNLPEELLVQEFGDTLVGYVQEHRYIMQTNLKGSSGQATMLMLMDENLIYVIMEKSDTIFRYPMDRVEEELLTVHKIQDDTKVILGDECPSVMFNTKDTDPKSPFTLSIGKYYYNPKYKLNKQSYANHYSGHWNAIISETGAICVRNEVRREPLYTSVMEAFAIIPKEVPDELFDVKLYNKVIVDLPAD